MDLKKLAPWNWFRKEEEQGAHVPIHHGVHPGVLQQPHPMGQLHREIDRLFDQAYRGFGLHGYRPEWSGFQALNQAMLKPILDLGVTDTEYSVSVEIPGVEENDVQLELTEDTLTIRGEKRQLREDKDKDYYRMERSYGAFQRVLSLPDDVDKEGIRASFKHGVLTVTMPRKTQPVSSVKRITVDRGE